MKITICGSMNFAKEMLELKSLLEKRGHSCLIPNETIGYAEGDREVARDSSEGARRKIEHDLIRDHHRKIEQSDAILVVNHTKRGVENYIGGNTFLEIGFAYILGKKIFLLNGIPSLDLILI
jgi:nucleoside 2-deoxyribosyltransferase